MPHLHLPTDHTDADLVLAANLAEVVGSEDLYVAWTHESGAGAFPRSTPCLEADARALAEIVALVGRGSPPSGGRSSAAGRADARARRRRAPDSPAPASRPSERGPGRSVVRGHRPASAGASGERQLRWVGQRGSRSRGEIRVLRGWHAFFPRRTGSRATPAPAATAPRLPYLPQLTFAVRADRARLGGPRALRGSPRASAGCSSPSGGLAPSRAHGSSNSTRHLPSSVCISASFARTTGPSGP